MIVVFGSINADLVVSVDRLPEPGETVKGPDFQVFPGGKGANQALAAARAGAHVQMIGAVGLDEFAQTALSLLRTAHVDLLGVRRVEGSTGLSMIAVDKTGNNQIVIASGANARVRATDLSRRLTEKTTLLMQLEIPRAEVEAAIRLARAAGSRIILNAAPAEHLPRDLLNAVDVLVVNTREAEILAAADGRSGTPAAFVEGFLNGGKRIVVVTRGAEGAIAHDGTRLMRAIAPELDPVDTTGAGDAFIGAMAAALDAGRPVTRALAEGVAAGSLACTETGAQPSLPTESDITELADAITVR